MLDSSSTSTGTLINGTDSGNAGYSIILENIQSDGATVVLSGQTLVDGNIADTWVHGDTVHTLHSCFPMATDESNAVVCFWEHESAISAR